MVNGMICDLSSRYGSSVNDGIPPELCSLCYAKLEDAVSVIHQLGKGTQLVKLDLKNAYRIVLEHSTDYHLLGIKWRGNTYINWALPFGLHLAPKIFNAIADSITWVLTCQGVQFQLHYLDDFFLLLGTPNSQQGREFLAIAVQTRIRLGIPIAIRKTQGPMHRGHAHRSRLLLELLFMHTSPCNAKVVSKIVTSKLHNARCTRGYVLYTCRALAINYNNL